VNEIAGIKESDTGLAHPSRWDLVFDKQMMQEEAPLQVKYPSQSLVSTSLCMHISMYHQYITVACRLHDARKS
jgi:hypothetical protein